jgi:hypothetical protein
MTAHRNPVSCREHINQAFVAASSLGVLFVESVDESAFVVHHCL